MAGVGGNGQEDLIDVLMGIQPPSSGLIRMFGRPVNISPRSAYRELGITIIPADRHREAVLLGLSLADNLMLRDYARPIRLVRGAQTSRRAPDALQSLGHRVRYSCSQP